MTPTSANGADRRRLLVVGLEPTPSHSGPSLVGPGSGTRLASLLGLRAWRDLPAYVDTANLCDDPDLDDRVIAACGRDVARALVCPERAEWGSAWMGPSGSLVVVIPHPSGRSRPYNDPQVVARVRRALFAARVLACRGSTDGWGDEHRAALAELADRIVIPHPTAPRCV